MVEIVDFHSKLNQNNLENIVFLFHSKPLLDEIRGSLSPRENLNFKLFVQKHSETEINKFLDYAGKSLQIKLDTYVFHYQKTCVQLPENNLHRINVHVICEIPAIEQNTHSKL